MKTNIQKFVLFMLPTNGGEGLVLVTAIMFELMLPLTPAQVLWINMVTSSTLGLALSFERPERNVMRRPPRDPRESLLSWLFAWRVLMVSLLVWGFVLGPVGALLSVPITVAVRIYLDYHPQTRWIACLLADGTKGYQDLRKP